MKEPLSPPPLLQVIEHTSDLLEAVHHEQRCGVNGLAQLEERRARRAQIETSWSAIQQTLRQVRKIIESLPMLPEASALAWAQGILSLPNLACMDIATAGPRETDEIVRVTLLDRSGALLEDVLIRPSASTMIPEIARLCGLTQEQLMEHGVAPAVAWERLQAAVRGRYIMSYHQEWDVRRLLRMAQRHQLPALQLIGGDLQGQINPYFGCVSYVSLSSLCERIGDPLPPPLLQTTLDRALGLLHVLFAMAEGITSVATWFEDVEADDDDEHPF